jgi:hypothetical protein
MGRALIFFAVFLAVVAVPQIILHALNYLYPAPPAFVEDEEVLRGSAAGFVQPALVLGKSVRPEFVRDARAVYPQVLQTAQVAQFGLTLSGASVLAARFATEDAATEARYALFRMLGKVDAEEIASGFWKFAWPQSGHNAIAGTAGRTFMMWVAPQSESLEALRSESRAFRAPERVAHTGLAGLVDEVRGWPASRYAPLLIAYTLFVCWIYLRLVVWATEVSPRSVPAPASATALREKLLAVRFLNAPITIAPGRKADQIVVDWKYADARWIDHARAHGMRKLHRLVLQLDEATQTVRGREYHSEGAWSAGMDGASIQWKASWEIVFYQYAHERVYGLQVGPDGKLTAALSYAYTFNLREMKDPIIAAVTAAGWRWKQVFLFLPPWLRWLHG